MFFKKEMIEEQFDEGGVIIRICCYVFTFNEIFYELLIPRSCCQFFGRMVLTLIQIVAEEKQRLRVLIMIIYHFSAAINCLIECIVKAGASAAHTI